MIVHSGLEELASKLRKHGYESLADEIDHVMLMGDYKSVVTLGAIISQYKTCYSIDQNRIVERMLREDLEKE